ncbi:hypothetical protein EMIT074MI3_30250 [Bacillus licheniformis]
MRFAGYTTDLSNPTSNLSGGWIQSCCRVYRLRFSRKTA